MSDASSLVYLAWRRHETRSIVPIGRLIERARDDYEFCYIRSVRRAQDLGFQALISFPELEATYRSGELPPLFHNRVMRASRPDFPAFVSELGLTKDVGPLPLMARSGGRRQTDELEVFAPPTRSENGTFETSVLVRGIRHLPRAEAALERVAAGDRLFIMADVQNEHGAHALALRTSEKTVVGYLPDYLARELRTHELAVLKSLRVTVEKVNPPPANVHHRLLCRVEFPPSVELFKSDDYRPLVDTADVAAE